jgi:hypothetical protein
LEQSAVEAASRAIVDILHDCGLAQLGDVKAAGETAIVPIGDFAINKQTEPIGMRELDSLRIVLQLDERIGHSMQPDGSQAFDSGVDQHEWSPSQ